jgi:hypothetical protein
MPAGPNDVRDLLRAFADAHDTEFYALWLDLWRQCPRPHPHRGFRIYRAGDDGAYLVVSATGTRADGREVCWSVSMQASADSLLVTGTVELADRQGCEAVFEPAARARESGQAAALVRELAAEVCRQQHWLDMPPGGRNSQGSEG